MFDRNRLVSLNHDEASVPPLNEGEAMQELVQWIQEHSMLCSAVANENQWNPETHQKWKESLLASSQKGRSLVQKLSSDKIEQMLQKLQEASLNAATSSALGASAGASSSTPMHAQFVPVAGSVRGKSAIPLSGFRRFDEQVNSVSQNAHLNLNPVNNMSSLVSSGAVSSVNGSSPLCSLQPSRTYIKKSGS